VYCGIKITTAEFFQIPNRGSATSQNSAGHLSDRTAVNQTESIRSEVGPAVFKVMSRGKRVMRFLSLIECHILST
jgi:hypothetical protein